MRWIINIASNYLRFVVSMAVMVFMTPYIIGAIGIENYGLWAIIFSIVGLLGLTDLGFATTAVKYVAEKQGAGDVDGRNQLLGSLFLIYLCTGLTCLLLTGLSGQFLNLGDQAVSKQLIWILGAATSLGLFLSVYRAVLVALGRQDLVSVITILAIVLQALLTVCLLEAGWGLTGLAWATAFGILAQAVLVIPLVYGVAPDFKPQLSKHWKQDVRLMWSFAFYALIANVSVLFVLKIAPLVIQAFLPLAMVAVYAVAAKIAEQLLLLNKQLSNGLMPLISQSKGAGNQQMISKVFMDGTRYLLAIAFPMLGLVFIYASELMTLWVGDEFAAAGLVLRILTIAVLFSAMMLNAANVLGMTGRHKLVAMALLGSAIMNLLCSILLVNVGGLQGVAWATFAGIFVCEFLVLVPAVCKSLALNPLLVIRKSILPGLLSCSPALALAWFLPAPQSLIQLLIGCALLGSASLIIFIIFCLRSDERSYLRDLFGSPNEEATSCAPSTAA